MSIEGTHAKIPMNYYQLLYRLLAQKVLLQLLHMTYDNHSIQPNLIPSHKASLII